MSQAKQSLVTNWSSGEILLWVMVVIAPLYSPENIGGSGLMMPGNISVWLVATWFIAHSIHKVQSAGQVVLPSFHLAILAVPVLITLSGFIAGVREPVDWFFRVVAIWLGYLFFLAVLQHRLLEVSGRILFAVVISALINALLGFIQVWFPELLPGLFTAKKIPEGLFQQINNHATYQVTATAIIFYLSATNYIREVATIKFSIAAATVVTAGLLVGMSGSRIGLLTLVLVWAFYIFFMFRYSESRSFKTGILLLVSVVALVVGQKIDGTAIDKTIAMQSGYSAESRLGIYHISASLVSEKPFFGHGLGSFASVFQHARPQFIEKHPEAAFNNRVVAHPHNEFLLWSVEGGIVALFSLVLLLVVTFITLRRRGAQGWLYFSLLLPIAMHTQVETPMYVSSLHFLLFLLILAIAFSQSVDLKPISISIAANKTVKISNISIATLLTLFLLHTAAANGNLVSYFKNMQPANRHLLQLPITNPYLSRDAIYLLHQEMMFTALKKNDEELLTASIEWAMNEVERLPNVELYYRLVNGYMKLDNHSSACEYALEGRSIFPSDEKLKDFLLTCE